MQRNAEPVALVLRRDGEGAALPLQVFHFRVFHGVKHDVRGDDARHAGTTDWLRDAYVCYKRWREDQTTQPRM
ncbi:hypothetical protein CKAH01_01476 [Colletotrichum kahawae]|uniref:Uncharacterized protein n=1 Tax=Colletotrichum kahawae TaxID=34407 RepID=A0AAD9Y7R9_COLKA|nr:hypothetical protein CKAH01_01476 [Colletotrichum kahawae]